MRNTSVLRKKSKFSVFFKLLKKYIILLDIENINNHKYIKSIFIIIIRNNFLHTSQQKLKLLFFLNQSCHYFISL